ncbi:uncharacterized protein [Atheta coriaria]|uniref:uncharacterized protein isoform X3 n=1 Tax=Dalotia coriaria TaxID=877792 RepID=UPI0031F3674B
MDIVTATPSSGSPFHNHDVREWSRLDSITGVLERARLETDHWTANTATTSHKYNKVVDSRARSGADGNLQQAARRKLEVFQSQVPGGRIQVIKTQTVSSSRWSSQGITNSTPKDNNQDVFEDLKLSLNPLDLTSEKAKASVGRGVGRRPPSRSRIRDDILARNSNLHSTATTNLHRVSRLCHQIHNSAVKQTFGKHTTCADTIEAALPIDERESGDGVEIIDITDEHEPVRQHTNLSRTKSTSSEDFFEKRKSLEDLEDLEQLQTWRRTSKLRRSLQYPKQKETQPSKPPDLPLPSGSVRKIREDLETGRRLNTALRGNNVDLDALDQILKSISNSSISSAQSDAKSNDNEPDGTIITAKKQQKRHSFVTVESIQAVRDKLRRTSSPTISIYEQEEEKTSRDEDDDGIVTDRPVNLRQLDTSSSSDTVNMSAHKSRYVRNEMDASKKQISGTGSLESRNKFNNYSKQDDWFARRKSYGFEQMQQPHAGGSDSLKNNKNRNESSTDSGICRSTEIVVVSPPSKVNVKRREFDFNDVIKDDNVTNVKKYAMIFENKNDSKNAIKNAPRGSEGKRHSIAVDESKYMNSNREENQFKRTSLVINDNNTNNINNKDDDNKKINKKVEFCKTEVHFAADSGRVNIVETDEKPPPTQRFRRRRRNSGPPEDYTRNGLPVQHFGDSTYEKFLFGDAADESSNGIYENLQNGVMAQPNSIQSNTKMSANVTVNAVNGNYFEFDEEPQKDNENEAPRGILKNKPIKPRPFLLGADNLEDSWTAKSKIIHEDQPIWKSTITLKNAQKDQKEEQEFQKLRQQLRPTNRRLDYSSEDNSTQTDDKSYCSAFKDLRVTPPEDECSSWSVADRIKQVEELKWTENKGYSTKVNFGDGEATVVENKHTTWPRKDEFKEVKKRNELNKSLIVRIGQHDDNSNSKHKICSKTMPNNANGLTTTTKITIDLSPSPTTADDANDFKFPRAAIQTFKSPSLIMNTFVRNDCIKGGSSIHMKPKLTGLEDLKQMYEDAHSDVEADKEVHRILMNSAEEHQSSVASGSWSKMRAFKQVHNYQKTQTNRVNGSHNHSLIEKESNKSTMSDKSYKYKLINDQIEQDLKYLNQEVINLNLNKSSISKSPLNNHHEKLSSPFLVGQSRSRTNSLSSDPESTRYDKKIESPKFSRRDPSPNRFGPSVLRQPKKSEMAYFGVNTSANSQKKTSVLTKTSKLSDKPDLLQFNNDILRNKSSYISSAPTSAPIYENTNVKSNQIKSTFDSSILEELTKAADEILLAVNGYTDEERSRMSTDDELKSRRRNEKLDTITENKSWKQSARVTSSNHISRLRNDKQKSSNSSIDSITRDVHRSFEQLDRKTASRPAEKSDQKTRKKTTTELASKTTTKARRLQRANSREALLHSHGSSSEDLPNHVEVIRKPRTVKRTKTAQLSVTATGLEMKKPNRKSLDTSVVHKSKHGERLPEILHKTAVTTIRSTAEKQAASRERAKLRSEETKKRQAASSVTKRETSKVTQNSKSVDRTKRSKESSRHTAMYVPVYRHRSPVLHVSQCPCLCS